VIRRQWSTEDENAVQEQDCYASASIYAAGCRRRSTSRAYEIEIDEELIPGLSPQVYRRMAARIRIQWQMPGGAGFQTVPINSDELEAIAARDAPSR
jgi:hypothetical protein